ncbi:RNA polymerase sigma-70 factor (ECF subfamily) [Rhodococcus sp. OK519]|uniref:RNA polymerase sigma factor n=1 Tax=Rhodococcus sp. OK519 TaxID=2135729 RepID=UPI000D49A00F|nr:RNA polymerase sigma-70 factor (ECF subfamily) [Rhodococcus sp. OK519]
MTEQAVDESEGLGHAFHRGSRPDDTFAAFVDRYGPELRRFCRPLAPDEDTAEDVVQETFIAAWNQLASFRGEASIRTWLFAICTRKIFDLHRRRRPDMVDDEILDTLPDRRDREPAAMASNNAFMKALDGALWQLPPRQRASWVMREVESMTFPEIGRLLGLSPDAARGQHRRAAASLAVLLEEWR